MPVSVLVVEDDPNIRELLQLYLEKRAMPSPWLPMAGRDWKNSGPFAQTWCCWM